MRDLYEERKPLYQQYADMTEVMTLARIYADHFYKIMDRMGLLQKGFELSIKVGSYDFGTFVRLATIDLEEDITKVGGDQWDKTRMYQMRYGEGGWRVNADPKAEVGNVPPEIRYEDRTVCKAERNSRTKPYPPDGFWIGDPRNDPPVDCGV